MEVPFKAGSTVFILIILRGSHTFEYIDVYERQFFLPSLQLIMKRIYTPILPFVMLKGHYLYTYNCISSLLRDKTNSINI